MDMLKDSILETATKYLEFWRLLAETGHVDMAKLKQQSSQLEESRIKVEETFKSISEILPENLESINIFADFLFSITNDQDVAQAL